MFWPAFPPFPFQGQLPYPNNKLNECRSGVISGRLFHFESQSFQWCAGSVRLGQVSTNTEVIMRSVWYAHGCRAVEARVFLANADVGCINRR